MKPGSWARLAVEALHMALRSATTGPWKRKRARTAVAEMEREGRNAGWSYRRLPSDEIERMRREMLGQYAPMTELIDDAPSVRAELLDDRGDLL